MRAKLNLRGQYQTRLLLPGELLALLGFVVMVIGAILYGQDKPGWPLMVFGLSCISVGLGLIAVAQGAKSDERMRAMANLEFREKIAVMNNYIDKLRPTAQKPTTAKLSPFDIKCIEQDLRAALELKNWVRQEQSYKEFSEVLQELIGTAAEAGEEEMCSVLQQVRDEANSS